MHSPGLAKVMMTQHPLRRWGMKPTISWQQVCENVHDG
jgi:hypothetical protein